jgi:hypothetical protein
MTSLDRSITPPTGELEAAFAAHLERGAIDIVEDEDSGDLEVHADAWTLALQGLPPTLAFFAIDDEPTNGAALGAALDVALETSDIDAMRRLDEQVGGALRDALRTSGDPLSEALAIRIDRGPSTG